MNVLITGGAGFIGSHVADELLSAGYSVRVLDSLEPQIHGTLERPPGYLHSEVEFLRGDLRDASTTARALRGIDSVVHFAAAVGVGQSMYEIERYTSINNLGTAVLLERLIKQPVQKLLVASSMSVYGEGAYRTKDGREAVGVRRQLPSLREGHWEILHDDGEPLIPVPTPETKTIEATSVYALSKYDQERLCLIFGETYNIPTVALRFFNVYGPRQALSNPYTGVLAIFASRLLNRRPPLIFEDGYQRRDFVSVHDVARACRLALETEEAAGQVFNIGSGHELTVRQIATEMADVLGLSEIPPEVTQRYRAGDIRHCFAEITKARQILGYEPRVSFSEGLLELASWLAGQMAYDRTAQAHHELAERGLTV